jgi:hypothetical protein
MKLKITLTELVQNARKAYDEGRLETQVNPGGMCTYSGGCAIGVSVPSALAKIWDDNDYSVVHAMIIGKLIVLHNGNVIDNTNPAWNLISLLQSWHDCWKGSVEESRSRYELEFRSVLEELEELVNGS